MREMKNMLFILNPKAGKKKAPRYLMDVVSEFNRAGYEVRVFVTAQAGDAVRMAKVAAEEMDTIVCCGGDGTFNETVSGVLASGARVDIGYLPAGTTNDFATAINVPTKIPKAVRAVVEGETTNYDVGQFGDRYFTYIASFGAFTRASYATSQKVKNVFGHMAYILSGIREIANIHKTHLRIVLDGETTLEDDYIFGAICNTTCMGGVLKLDPKRVDMCDGKFEVLLIRSPKNLAELTGCVRALKNKKYNSDMITFVSASTVEVFAEQTMDWTLDGEHATGQNVVIRNLHNAIRLIRKG